MAVKKYKPYTPSRRFMIGYDFSDLTQKRPEKSLTKTLGRTGGRNNQGRITSRFMAGGHKRLYRIIDFKGYNKIDIPARVAAVEYDPYRTARIVLLNYVDGEKRYVLGWKGATVGQVVMNGNKGDIASGNRRQLKDIPEGMNIFNLEITPFSEGKLIKSAGSLATIAGRDEALKVVFVKMPSGEVRKFNENCWATIGELSNGDHKNVVIGKAGRQRWLGRKPRVLGKNMNPVDHPHGGGNGKAPIGKPGPVTPWGKPALGYKTRKKHKESNKFIVTRRKK